jgi:hypothetical protein
MYRLDDDDDDGVASFRDLDDVDVAAAVEDDDVALVDTAEAGRATKNANVGRSNSDNKHRNAIERTSTEFAIFSLAVSGSSRLIEKCPVMTKFTTTDVITIDAA